MTNFRLPSLSRIEFDKYPVSSSLLNFAIGNVLKRTAEDLPDGDIERQPGHRLTNSEYANHILLLASDI